MVFAPRLKAVFTAIESTPKTDNAFKWLELRQYSSTVNKKYINDVRVPLHS